MRIFRPYIEGSRWCFMRLHEIPDLFDPTDIYLRRWRFVQTPWFGVYLHQIRRPDHDRDLHDHPWRFMAALIVRGGYVEDVADGLRNAVAMARLGASRSRTLRPFSINVKHQGQYHSIRKLLGDDAWTFVVVGPRVDTWGYATAEGHVEHAAYWKQMAGDSFVNSYQGKAAA